MQTENHDMPAKTTGARGRPRDPELEPRVFDAAMALYGQEGWAGFSFEVIAKAAGVGKNALYRRWPSKGSLLREMLEARWVAVDRIDCGAIRDDLVALCRMLFAHLSGPLGSVGLQLQLDLVRHEVVAEAVASYREDVKRSARQIVRRAIDRGELPEDTSTTLVLDVIAGSVMSHVMATPDDLREEMQRRIDAYAGSLVDLVLSGIAAARPD